MIIDQEEKFKAIFNSKKEKPSEKVMFSEFLRLYPLEWKQLKTNFSKFNRSKKFGKTIPLPKPEVSLRVAIRIWLKKQ